VGIEQEQHLANNLGFRHIPLALGTLILDDNLKTESLPQRQSLHTLMLIVGALVTWAICTQGQLLCPFAGTFVMMVGALVTWAICHY